MLSLVTCHNVKGWSHSFNSHIHIFETSSTNCFWTQTTSYCYRPEHFGRDTRNSLWHQNLTLNSLGSFCFKVGYVLRITSQMQQFTSSGSSHLCIAWHAVFMIACDKQFPSSSHAAFFNYFAIIWTTPFFYISALEIEIYSVHPPWAHLWTPMSVHTVMKARSNIALPEKIHYLQQHESII